MSWFIPTVRYLGGILLFAGGALLCNAGAYGFSAALFLILGTLECFLIYSEDRRILNLRTFMTISWWLGVAAASLKLSLLSSPFGVKTWMAIGGFYFAFLFAYDLVAFLLRKRRAGEPEAPGKERSVPGGESNKRIFFSIFIVGGLSLAGLLAEAIRYDFQFPIFVADTPHAYTEFHLTGVHYFVVTSVFVPALTVYYLFREKPDRLKKALLIAVNLAALAVPVLLLSKIYLALSFAFPFLVFLLMQKRFSRKKIFAMMAGIAVLSAVAFAVLVSRRQYPEGYLESIFRFKDPNTPVALQYPYIYVANNFENLNLLIESNDPLTYGIRQSFPAAALTGLKFLGPIGQLYVFPQHHTIEELTTRTLIYDAYGDFGSAGVIVFGILLGLLAYFLTDRVRKRVTLVRALLYAQISVYFGLAFFSTWFSEATTWFWFAATAAIGIFVREKKPSGEKGLEKHEKSV
ncbi:MAG: oligosaccharide repeat unit polymerase [Lachnospiraceae bacterium]|nr:oligosaccharide repeat unit polymerase [Lachnospiraceae bacterium]